MNDDAGLCLDCAPLVVEAAPPALAERPAVGAEAPTGAQPVQSQLAKAQPTFTPAACHNCELPLSAQARFCRRCGTAQPRVA